MSSKYFLTIADSNERAGTFLESFVDNIKKTSSFDIIAGSRFFNNWHRSLGVVKDSNDLLIIKSQFNNNHNIYLASSYNEGATDIPKSISLYQNFAEINNVCVVSNGNIKNKEIIARKYEFTMGLSDQEFIAHFYNSLMKRNLKDNSIINMMKEIESDMISFIIFDKNINSVFVYNKGDNLYISNVPGISVSISTEILPANNTYPNSNFHKLPGLCILKIDYKTLLVQNVPIMSNFYSYGSDLMIDNSKGLLYTENCDMEFLMAMSILSNKEITKINDLQVVYFGFETDIDNIILEKIKKIRKELKVEGKTPIKIPYNFVNIYASESELIDEINRQIAEKNAIDPLDTESVPVIKKGRKSKLKDNNNDSKDEKKNLSLAEKSLYETKKINFIAMSLLNWALEKGVGCIYIPNTNKKNDKLISVLSSMIKAQIYKPIYVFSILENFNIMDEIKYLISCKNYQNLDDILINCARKDIKLGIDEKGKTVLKYDGASEYNYEITCAFFKSGLENPFLNKYTDDNHRVDNQFVNANITPAKIMNNQEKTIFLHNIETIVKNELEYSKKLQSVI